MQRKWEELDEFPNYVVSTLAEFANMRTDREVRPSRNQLGHAKVTLNREGRQHTRSVAQLVAQTFIPRPKEHFDTPIHLDGDLMNCQVENLMWRPRWFAIKFHKQFQLEAFHEDRGHRVDLDSGEEFHCIKDICTRYGLYYYDVVKSCVEGTFVFPTWQEFRDV